MQQDLRQLIWSILCVLFFLMAIWFAYSQLGTVARRSVIIVGCAGAALALISAISMGFRVLQNVRSTQESGIIAASIFPTFGDIAPALWLAGFFVSTIVFGMVISIVLFSLPALVIAGRQSIFLSVALTGILVLILFGLDIYLGLTLPKSIVF